MTIFADAGEYETGEYDAPGDYEAFEQFLAEAVERTGTWLLAYTLMPNHWRLVVWLRKDGPLSRFVGWLTLTPGATGFALSYLHNSASEERDSKKLREFR